MTELPETLLKSSHFNRYYRIWKRNEASIIFVPLAEMCRGQGFLQEAREICEEGLKHHPESVSGRIVLARTLIDLKEKEGVVSLLKEILQDFPSHREAQGLLSRIAPGEEMVEAPLWETCTMAQILVDQGEKKKALQILNNILTRDPTHVRAQQLKEVLCPPRSSSSTGPI